MTTQPHWSDILPLPAGRLADCIGTQGSLTEYLMASGQPFAVQVLAQGETAVLPDEQEILQVSANTMVYARHVCLTLAGEPVVVARSVTRPDCQVWRPILERGARSLGFTLFGGLPELQRDALQFAEVQAPHGLYQLAAGHAANPALLARRCRFALDAAPLLVCEVFLPALENYLK
ncbi:chorismate lyase [Vogesella sp. LIG4]|uniref:chorismate--pyruvate lyase family protein n=1 Tax=Vogesella sp. LIG4 TaxID=1192162 RepID=UPI001E2976DC|nr:chorismate lyase [Vogesella sp. LIG4]